MPKNLKLVSIHDLLTPREARSDPTGSRARIKGEPIPEEEGIRNTRAPLHSWALSGAPAPGAEAPLRGWALSGGSTTKPRSRNSRKSK